MIKIIYSIILLSCFSTYTIAQNQGKSKTGNGQHNRNPHAVGDTTNHKGQMGPNATPEQKAEGRANKLTQQLSLTPEQNTKLKSLFLQHEQDMKALFAKHEQDINAIFTPEQKVKYDSMKGSHSMHGGGKGPNRKGGNK